MEEEYFKQKFLKYKLKYNNLLNFNGGSNDPTKPIIPKIPQQYSINDEPYVIILTKKKLHDIDIKLTNCKYRIEAQKITHKTNKDARLEFKILTKKRQKLQDELDVLIFEWNELKRLHSQQQYPQSQQQILQSQQQIPQFNQQIPQSHQQQSKMINDIWEQQKIQQQKTQQKIQQKIQQKKPYQQIESWEELLDE